MNNLLQEFVNCISSYHSYKDLHKLIELKLLYRDYFTLVGGSKLCGERRGGKTEKAHVDRYVIIRNIAEFEFSCWNHS